ncbi:MAG: hypothetical protein ABH951_01605 [Patescibacteria group bacterium]
MLKNSKFTPKIIIIILVVVVAVIFLGAQLFKSSETTDWKTYANDKFELGYPQDFTVTIESSAGFRACSSDSNTCVEISSMTSRWDSFDDMVKEWKETNPETIDGTKVFKVAGKKAFSIEQAEGGDAVINTIVNSSYPDMVFITVTKQGDGEVAINNLNKQVLSTFKVVK